MRDRIRKSSLLKLLTTPEQAAAIIDDGMNVAMSGYSAAGYPKAVVDALIDRKQNGEDLSLNIITGANVPWIDEKLGSSKMISRRIPMCASRTVSSQANNGSIHYVEQQMHKMPRLLRNRDFGTIDVAIVEALGFDEIGNLIPSNANGMLHQILETSNEIIVEVNTAQPDILWDIHDIFIPQAPPNTKPIPLIRTNQRIGKNGISVDPKKIRYIVVTNEPEELDRQSQGTDKTNIIADHLFNFLELEIQRTGGKLPPIQTGFGSIANSIAHAFQHSNFHDLQFFCGGINPAIMELLFSGKATALSTGGLGMSKRVEEILNEIPNIQDHLVIRNGDITNNPEIIGRLGLLALNTGIEVDIYGNVNSSHIGGSHVVNGIGGGANFSQNAGLSVILIPSTAKGENISSIVPMVSHQDICEHDVDVVITENGIADLRGLDDSERADAIISNCASHTYKEQLERYLSMARSLGGHHPQLPEEAFAWFRRFQEKKTMLENR